MKSREESNDAEVRQGVLIWASQLEMDGAPIPWDSTIWES